MPKQMVQPKISEMSGVDHPAHLAEGWLLMKAVAVGRGEDPNSLSKGQDMPDLSDEERAALPENVRKYVEDVEARVAKSVEADEPTAAEVFEKSIAELPEAVRKALITQQREAAEATAMAKALYDEREDAKFEAVAKSLEHLPEKPDSFAKDLRSLAEADPAAYARVEKALRAAEVAVAASPLFKEVGSSTSAPGSAVGKVEAIAKGLQETDPSLSDAEAFSKAIEANPDLYNQHLSEV